jgi:hypothetical protein
MRVRLQQAVDDSIPGLFWLQLVHPSYHQSVHSNHQQRYQQRRFFERKKIVPKFLFLFALESVSFQTCGAQKPEFLSVEVCRKIKDTDNFC